MNKIETVQAALLRKDAGKYPIFFFFSPQFLEKIIGKEWRKINYADVLELHSELDLDVIQVGHPSFYPVKVMELDKGEKYKDDFNRTHVITEYYDEFCEPFPLKESTKLDVEEVERNWEKYEFPDPRDEKWFSILDEIVSNNDKGNDPMSVWGVINGPFEPTWQLLSDGWLDFFILARKKKKLALSIINKVSEYCIQAGAAMIEHGVNAIRIGDDYALNRGLMVAPKTWRELIQPYHEKLVFGLKKSGGKDFPVILHSDGNITSLFPELMKSGIDALNPIQPDALEFNNVVNAVGHELALTGAFDLRLFMNDQGPYIDKKLFDETKKLYDIMDNFNNLSSRTGFCIGPTHQIQPSSEIRIFKKWVEIAHDLNKINY